MIDKKTRIGLVSTSFPLNKGSISGLFVENLATAIAEIAEVKVLTPATNSPYIPEKTLPYSLHPIRYGPQKWQILCHQSGGIPVALKNKPYLYALLPIFLVSIFFACIKLSRSVDLFQANWAITGVCTGLAGKLTKKPVITTFRGEDITRAKKGGIDRLILKLAINLSTSIVAVSQEMSESLTKEFPLSAEKIHFIANGVPTELLQTPKEKIKKKTIRIITVANLIPRKGLDQILQALAKISPDIRPTAKIIGDGYLHEKLEQTIKQLEIKNFVELTGTLSHKKVIEELLASDLFIFTSYSEGRPNALVEAMAAELPVIVTNISGMRELITNGQNGFLYEPDDIDNLAALISTLSTNSTMRHNMGARARQTVINHNLDWNTTAQNYLSLYQGNV